MSQSKRAPKKSPRTAIVPRIVFQTAIAVSVIPVAGGAMAGCVVAGVAASQDARFSGDAGLFSVAMPQPDANADAAFSVADVGFSVADGGFSVAIEVPDAGSDTGARG